MNKALFVVASFLLSACALASPGNPLTELPWNRPTEVLLYHSCGCADSRWIAEVKNKRNQKNLARLRCDCERSYFSVGNGAEQVYQNSCQAFEGDNKFEAIDRVLHEMLQR
jgi:hypothetical protein